MTHEPGPALYNRFPATALAESATIHHGDALWKTLANAARAGALPPLLVIDAYPGVDLVDLTTTLSTQLPDFSIINIEEIAALPTRDIDALLADTLTSDPVLGIMSDITIDAFYQSESLRQLRNVVARAATPTVIIGWGASRVAARPHVLVLADMPRWEIQQRQRSGATNWRAENHQASNQEKFKRGYFAEWRAADRHKTTIASQIDYLLDTTRGCENATLLAGDDYRDALKSLVGQPFRVVPFFDPGVWGGEWMRSHFRLEEGPPNYAWCFDCVPEENSLLFFSGEHVVEVPAINLVLGHPRELLGDRVFEQFGAEFPIRFDLLDTVGGQNLSLQVHPLTTYIREHFGMAYTQDESYYILDATEGSTIFLGLKNGVDREAMVVDLYESAKGGKSFPAEKYVNQFPVKKHDHISIPAGTIHCSGSDTMVLEISATPYIFTFKLWDWDRVDLNGKPRPLHLGHGVANIQWDRDTTWVTNNLLVAPLPVTETGENREEQTGLHRLEFIETRRCWFREAISLHTQHTVTVMTLVEGDIIEIRSPDQAFAPFTLRYGETVIIPAGIGAYTLTRSADARAAIFATVRGWVRDTGTIESS